MNFYQEKCEPVLRKAAKMIEETPHMQDIVKGVVPEEKMQFQIKQNYNYLMDYCRCWAVGFSKCKSYEEMMMFYPIVKSTMESTIMTNRTYWAEQLHMSTEEMDSIIEAPGKRSYTAFQLMCAEQGDLAETMMALFPCNIMYRYFGEDLLGQCKLPTDNMFYQWLDFYTTEEYVAKCENEIAIVNTLCANKTEKEQAKLLEILATSCNYEILQWQHLYYEMETWPLDDIFPAKFTTCKD